MPTAPILLMPLLFWTQTPGKPSLLFELILKSPLLKTKSLISTELNTQSTDELMLLDKKESYQPLKAYGNSKLAIESGVDILVSGTTIFKNNNGDIKKNIDLLRSV